MNIQYTPSFTGKYIVKGRTEDVNNTEELLKGKRSKVYALSTYKIKYRGNKTTAIFATNKDAQLLEKAKHIKENPLVIDKEQSTKTNLINILSSVFGQSTDILKTRVLRTEDILENTQDTRKPKFIMDEGIITNIPNKHLDGSVSTYYEKGQIMSIKSPDGSQKVFYPDGKISLEDRPDGSRTIYFEDGNTQAEYNADGSGIEYYSNGNTKRKITSDGHIVSYYPNKQIESITLSNGKKKEYYQNGNLKTLPLEDGGYKSFYENGSLSADIKADGSGLEYYENGRIAVKQYSDGRRIELYPNGIKKSEIKRDGTIQLFYEDGKIQGERKPDGTTKQYNKKGFLVSRDDINGLTYFYIYGRNNMLSHEKISDGTIRDFNRGQLVRERLSDGTIREFAPYTGKVFNSLDSMPGYTKLHGYIRVIKSPDGSFRRYNENGELTAQKTANGKLIVYKEDDDN
ncbi:hypothetical protein IJ182_08455 [bacterium]|nr:hypothetical protein [bacterium]